VIGRFGTPGQTPQNNRAEEDSSHFPTDKTFSNFALHTEDHPDKVRAGIVAQLFSLKSWIALSSVRSKNSEHVYA